MSRLSYLLITMLLLGILAPFVAARIEAPRQGPPDPLRPADPAFEQRKEALLAGIIAAYQDQPLRGKFAYWQAQALLAAGHTEDGIRLLEANLETNLEDVQGDRFGAWAMADAYWRWRSVLPASTKESFKRQLTGYADYAGGRTENHRLMLATARYLAGEAWPDAPFASSFRDEDPSGRRFLLNRMNRYVHRGTAEFDSPAYQTFYIGPMRSLADLAPDPAVRQQAAMTAAWLILENAGEWLDGHWLSASLRYKREYDGQDAFLSADYVLWLYFGASFTPDFASEKALFAVQAAVSPYRFPASVTAIAANREHAFVHRETDRWMGRHHYKTTYLNRTYGVYSVMEDYPVHTAFSEQYHRWAVQWLRPSGTSRLYVKHPHPVTGEEGTTGYEQVWQHEGTVLAVYALPEDDAHPWVRLRTPLSFRAVIDESDRGDVFFHYGSVLVALRLSEAFGWDASSDAHAHRAGMLGVVIETALPEAYPGPAPEQLRAFKEAVQAHALRFSAAGGVPTLRYQDLHGARLSITYGGARTVNGRPVDLHTWPLLEDPWMQQRVNEDRLVIQAGTRPVVYDFGTWTER